MNWLERFRSLPRLRRLSIFFGFVIAAGLVLILIGSIFSIRFTPYATYTNKNLGVTIKFPAYWKYQHSQIPGAVIVFVAPPTQDEEALHPNFNVSYKDLPQSMTTDRLTKMITTQVAGTFGDHIDIVENIPIKLSGRPGYRLAFAGYGQNMESPILYVVAWTNIENRVFVLTFVCLQKDYPKFKSKVNTMINSFKLFPPNSKT